MALEEKPPLGVALLDTPELDPEYLDDLTAIEAGVPKPTISKLSYRHLRLLDFMMKNPHMRLGEIADHLNYTLPWVSIITNSDLFRAEFKRRRQAFEMLDNNRISDKITKLADLGLDGMIEKIERPVDLESGDEGPSFNEYRAATELALKAAGYLTQSQTKIVNNNNVVMPIMPTVNPDVLVKARAKMLPPIEGQSGE